MNDSKKIFTPEQEEKLAKIANRLEEDGVILNLLYVYMGEKIKPLSRLFIAFHLLKTLYKDNAASVLDQLQQENDRELNRILEIVEKEIEK